MAWHIDPATKDLVFDGWEMGIAPSPHKGIGNIQNANIATETGEVMASYSRTQDTMTSTSGNGTLTFIDTSHVSMNISGSNNHFKGMWINVSSSSHTGELPNGNYWVILSSGGGYVLSATYDGSGITGYTAGLTATISLIRSMSTPVAYTIETYAISSSATYYRYYVLDSQSLVWVYDSVNEVIYSSTDSVSWFLPDISITYFTGTTPSGIGVLNGWLHLLAGNTFWVKSTVKLGSSYLQMTNAYMMSRSNSLNPHFALVGHQGRLNYTDGNYVGSIFPDTSIESGVANIQSYASYSAVSTTGTITTLISGSIPSTGINVGGTGFSRIPAVFFAGTGGTIPSGLSAHVVYWISYSTANENFEVYAAQTGGSAIDIASGSSGTQYFNTYYPTGTHAGAYGDHTLMSFTPQRLNLPIFEISKSLGEIGNTLLVGCLGNIVYPWNQVDATPSNIIALPEANTTYILTVNQMAYLFSGYKGNVYITDGSVASLVLKVPDYCAGIAGTQASYFEPIYTWGGAMYLRGRVYFSILDQTSSKTGNCGGVWSFYPTQNLYVGQDTGLALRLENINSYETYNGVATVLIPLQTQNAISPQYFSGWYSSITSATYGIDKTNTTVSSSVTIETDLAETGTMLQKKTFKQIEYKLAQPLDTGELVRIYWRLNRTDAFTLITTSVVQDSTTSLSGYYPVDFEKSQWLQIKAVLVVNTSSSSSKVPLTEIRVR